MEKDIIYLNKNIYFTYFALPYFTLLYSLLTLSIVSSERVNTFTATFTQNELLLVRTHINKRSINFNWFNIEDKQEAKKKNLFPKDV